MNNSILSAKKTDVVSIKISWDYKNYPLTMKLYEPSVQKPIELWQTGNSEKISNIPTSIEIENSELKMEPGSKKLFVLVTKNNSKEPVYFFAAPHKVSPEEFSLGFKFKCLCVNHAFKVPPGEYWYRVVELIMSKKYSGDKIEIKHSLIGIDEERMKEFEQNNSLSN